MKAVITSTEDLGEVLQRNKTTVSATVINEKTHTHGDRNIEIALLPEDCRERKLDGKPWYFLIVRKSGVLVDLETKVPREVKAENLPQLLYLALQHWRFIPRVFRFSDNWGEKVKLIFFYVFAGCSLFVFFLILTMAMGAK